MTKINNQNLIIASRISRRTINSNKRISLNNRKKKKKFQKLSTSCNLKFNYKKLKKMSVQILRLG